MWKALVNLKICKMLQNSKLLVLLLVVSQLTLTCFCTGNGISMETDEDSESSSPSFQNESNEFGSESTPEPNSGSWSNPQIDFTVSRDDDHLSYKLVDYLQSASFVVREFSDEIFINCKAPYPIEWRPSSLMLTTVAFKFSGASRSRPYPNEFPEFDSSNSQFESTDMTTLENKTKTTADDDDAPTLDPQVNLIEFLYELWISFELTPSGIFGYLGTCQRIPEKTRASTAIATTRKEKETGNPPLATKFNLFTQGKDSTANYFIGAGRRFKIKNYHKTKTWKYGEAFLIPCPLVNPNITSQLENATNIQLRLVRIFSGGSANETFDYVESTYDPDAGFYITQMGMEKLDGTFWCQFEVEVTSASENPKAQRGNKNWNVMENVTFEFLQTQLNQNSVQDKEGEDWVEVTNGDQKFKNRNWQDVGVKIEVRNDLAEIQCHLDKHEHEDTKLDSSSFLLIQCPSRVQCNHLRGSNSLPSDLFGEEVEKGGPCRTEDETCLTMPVPSVDGLVKCTFGEKVAYAYSFTGVDDKKYYMNTVNDELPPKSALIFVEIQYPKSGRDRKRECPVWDSVTKTRNFNLFTDEEYRFTCTPAKFLFMDELVFLAEYKNGSRIYFPEASIHKKDTYQSKESQLKVKVTLDMTGVVCLAPWSNSSEWMGTSINFIARDVSKPEIQTEAKAQTKDEGNPTQEEKVFYVGENEKNLVCGASGQPLPDFKWALQNGTEIPPGNNSTFLIRFQKSSSTLQFPTITKELEGVYICEARNEFGTELLQFHVKVQVRVAPDSHLSLGAGEISGIVIAVVIFLAAFVLLAYKYFETRKQLRNLTADEIDEFEKGHPEELKNVAEIQGENVHLLPFNKQYEVSDSDYSIDQDKTLGSGEFGVVYGGKLGNLPVAIKTTKSTADVDFFKAFLKEIKVMTYIGKHPNVVQLLGTSTNKIRQRIVYVIVELGAHGSLYSFLKDNENGFVDTISSSQLFNISPEQIALISTGYANELQTSDVKITTLDFVKWCAQIAAGMSYLASKKIIHRDLAARNILWFDDYTAKITDFGLSRQLYTSVNYVRKNQNPLPWRSMAPESLKHLTFSTKSDVWSFGVLVWEIFNLAAVPFAGLSWTQEFLDDLEQGKRLQKPHRASDEIYENMCLCWHPLPEKRPDFDQLEKFYNDQLKTETVYLTLA